MSLGVAPQPSDDGPAPIVFAAPDIDATDEEAVLRVLRSGWLTTGRECLALEDELAAHCGAAHVVAVSSCTAALEIALAHLDLPPGARVGVPTWTFVSSALAAHRAGAVPVLLDVDASTLNVSPEAIDAEIEGLDAVVVVHFGGVAVERAVLDRAATAGVPVVEDAAHTFGARDHRGPMAGVGTAGACFSFYATKNLTSGEGGALATDDAELAAFARTHRLHGLTEDSWARYLPGGSPSYDLEEPGLKANMPDLLAALARTQLARFDQMQARRREIVALYRDRLDGVVGVDLVPARLDPDSADHLMVVLLPDGVDRDAVVKDLTAAGIGASIHFRPLHTFRWFAEHAQIGRAGVSTADRLGPRALSLPLHPRLSDGDVARVCDALVQALGR